jgi:glycosyltransferase involved in cell wall biosynthesis
VQLRRAINLFYEEPDPDRWLPFDHWPRRLIRRLVRGPHQPGGQMRVFLNLAAGLDRIGVPYRINDYRHVRANPGELACLIGKPHILRKFSPRTPLLFGSSIYNHPIDDESLPSRHAIRQVLVPSAWVQRMFSTVWPGIVSVWPVGIDTSRWAPEASTTKDVDILFYDKISRDRQHYEATLIDPLMDELRRRGLVVEYLRYGTYREHQFHAFSRRARSMIYLSRYETQGIALEQMLAAGVPVLVWDAGGEWQNLEYLLRGVRFSPVTTVPYWDDRCGRRFTSAEDFPSVLDDFWRGVQLDTFAPREMIVERKLTLEGAAQAYVDLVGKYDS